MLDYHYGNWLDKKKTVFYKTVFQKNDFT